MRLTRKHITHLPLTPISRELLRNHERNQQVKIAAWVVAFIVVAEIVLRVAT